ncbi:MAG: GNAT family N-acetyltransferase [Coprobacillaceae bacterium]
MKIQTLDTTNLDAIRTLVWKIFLKFEAPEYTQEGINNFKAFLDNSNIMETVEFWGAFENDVLVGIIAMRSERSHVCLFFVDEGYQGQGIGRKLWNYVIEHTKVDSITVNSSPYAVEIYHALGFKDTDIEQTTDGIRYTPMKYANI